MAAGTLDKTIFNDLLNEHKAQLSVDVELEKTDNSTKKVVGDANDRIAAIKAETEELKKQRQEKGQENGKEDDMEKKEDVLKPSESKSVNEGNELESLKKEVEYCRKMYASIEYNDKAKLDEARKGLGSKVNEESTSTKDARALYEKTLTRLKEARIKDLENDKNLSVDDLKKKMHELVLEFGYKEAVDLYNERTDAKAENLMSKKWGSRDFAQKLWGSAEKITNKYNKWPLYVKLGISAAVFTAGAYGAIGIVGAKRVFSGVVAGVGSAKLLDALHQKGMKKDAGKDAEKFLAEMEKDGGADKFKNLSALLDSKIANVDDQLKKQKNVALINKFIGITAGVFLGSGMASKAIGAIFHHGTPSVPKHNIGVDSTVKQPAYPDKNMFNPKDLAGPHGAEKAAAAAGSAAENAVNAQEKIGEHLTIEKGSSIEKTLINYYKGHNLHFKDGGHAAHIAYRDYMTDYIESHKEELMKSGKLAEYQKMLKDGMVNVKPGTEIVIDPHTGNIVSIDGKLSHLNVHHGVHHHGGGHLKYTDIEPTPQPEAGNEFTGDATQIGVENQVEMQNLDAHAQDLEVEIAPQEEIVHSGSNEVLVSNYNANPNAFTSQIGNTENVAKMAENVRDLKVDLLHTNKVLYKLATENQYIIEHPEDINRNASIIRDGVFGKGAKAVRSFKEISGYKVHDVLNDSEKLAKIPKKGQEVLKGVLKTVPAKDGDTLHKWFPRVAIYMREMNK